MLSGDCGTLTTLGASKYSIKRRWFKPWRWVCRPTSWQGAVVALGAAAFSAQVLVAVDRNSHSATDTFYGVFPYLVATWTLAYWVAAKTSWSEP